MEREDEEVESRAKYLCTILFYSVILIILNLQFENQIVPNFA